MAISFDSPLVKTILLVLACGLLVWLLVRTCNWGPAARQMEQFQSELEPVTYSENFAEEDDMAEDFEDDMEEEFEKEDEEGFDEDEADMEGFYDDDEEE